MSRITYPVLYRNIDHQMYKHPPRVHSAIRTLLKKPELAQKVEVIAIRDPQRCESFWDLKSWRQWAEHRYNAALELADQSLFLAKSQGLLGTVPTHEHIMEREEAQVALLICLCPNLLRLYFENPSTSRERPRFMLDHMILDIIHPRIREGTMLQKLEAMIAVTARLEGGQGGFRLSSIATFFHLPNLRRITCVACMEPEDDMFVGFDCAAGTSSVRDVKLVRSAVCPVGLNLMIKACKQLDKFECDWAGETVGWVEINFPVLREALLTHKETLTVICLDTRKHFDSWPERDNGLVPPFGSPLTEFKKLKTLDVPASVLIGWDEDNVGGYESLKDVLPDNIEELKINEYAPRLFEMLEDFVSVSVDKCPQLKKLTISPRHAGGADVENNLKGKFAESAPEVEVLFEDGEEVDHFDVSVEEFY